MKYLKQGSDVVNVLCHNCNIYASIGLYRERLNDMIVEKNYNLLEYEIIDLSKLLDTLIDKCVFCERKLNTVQNLEIKVSNINA